MIDGHMLLICSLIIYASFIHIVISTLSTLVFSLYHPLYVYIRLCSLITHIYEKHACLTIQEKSDQKYIQTRTEPLMHVEDLRSVYPRKSRDEKRFACEYVKRAENCHVRNVDVHADYR